jgi:IS1 family transposase
MRSCAMGMPPMASKSIAVTPAGSAVARTRLPMSIQKLVARRFCMPTKNEAACVASPARLGSLGQPCPAGSKKRSLASSFTDNPARSRPRGSHFHCTGTGRTVAVCAARHVKWSPMHKAIGAGKTCQCLWEAIPAAYRQGHCFTDLWAAYRAVIPEEHHTAVGKETGETAHVERWNNTLRQRLARCVRMTLSFSKSEVMHEACLLLFLHRYNKDRAILLK